LLGADGYVRDTCIGAADSEGCTPSTQHLDLQN
jgi:hypothetical protein